MTRPGSRYRWGLTVNRNAETRYVPAGRLAGVAGLARFIGCVAAILGVLGNIATIFLPASDRDWCYREVPLWSTSAFVSPNRSKQP